MASLPCFVSLSEVARRLQLTHRRAEAALAAGLLRPVGSFLGGPVFDLEDVQRLGSDLTIACLRQRDPRGRKSPTKIIVAEVGEVAQQLPAGSGANVAL